MKRGSTEPQALVIRRYGVRGVVDWRPELEAELRRANSLCNQFIEHFRSAEERYRAAVDAASGPEAAAIEDRIARLAEHYDELRRARMAKRRESGRRIADRDAAVEERQLRLEISTARAALRTLHKHAAATCKDALAEIETWRRKADDDARRGAGVYWGTANALQNRFDGARKALLQRRAQGLPAEMRFRPFRGEGLIHNQIQGGISAQEFAERYLIIGGNGRRDTQARVVAYTERDRPAITVTRKRKGKTEVYQTQGRGEPKYVSAAITMHRELDPKSRIKDVELVLQRTPRETALTKDHWSAARSRLIISGERKDGEVEPCAAEVLAINLGWRITDDGLRVAQLLAIPHASPSTSSYRYASSMPSVRSKKRRLPSIPASMPSCRRYVVCRSLRRPM
jgi:hypothetical protein